MKDHLTTRNVIIVALVLLIALQWWQQNRDDRGGGDEVEAQTAAREAVVRFAAEHEAMYEAAADAIERGDITTARELLDWVKQHRDHAKQRAFEQFNAMFDDELPREADGKLDSRPAAAFVEAAARGFGEIE